MCPCASVSIYLTCEAFWASKPASLSWYWLVNTGLLISKKVNFLSNGGWILLWTQLWRILTTAHFQGGFVQCPNPKQYFSQWHSSSPCKGSLRFKDSIFQSEQHSLTGGYMTILLLEMGLSSLKWPGLVAWGWLYQHKILALSSPCFFPKCPFGGPSPVLDVSLHSPGPSTKRNHVKKIQHAGPYSRNTFSCLCQKSEGALPSLAHFCAKWLQCRLILNGASLKKRPTFGPTILSYRLLAWTSCWRLNESPSFGRWARGLRERAREIRSSRRPLISKKLEALAELVQLLLFIFKSPLKLCMSGVLLMIALRQAPFLDPAKPAFLGWFAEERLAIARFAAPVGCARIHPKNGKRFAWSVESRDNWLQDTEP